jgi:MFS family permease
VGGVFADVLDRRKLLIVIEVTMAAMSAILALCTLFHIINIYIIYVVVLVAASVSSFEYPTRQAIIPTLVPREQLAGAVSMSMVMMQDISVSSTLTRCLLSGASAEKGL